MDENTNKKGFDPKPNWLLRSCYSRNLKEAFLTTQLPIMVIFFLIGYRREMGPIACAGWIFLGLLYWTLIEYILHRWVFHWSPDSPKLRELVHRIHIHHHQRPQDLGILTGGPAFVIPLGSFWFLIAALALRSFQAASLVIVGSALGHFAYEWMHYDAHAGRRTDGWRGFLRKYHLAHHNFTWEKRYGVTSPFWDLVFGTYIPLRQARKVEGAEGTNSLKANS